MLKGTDIPPINWTPNKYIRSPKMIRKYASFTKELKLETLKLAESTELSIAQFARNLRIRRNMIYKWRKQMAMPQALHSR